MNLDHDDDDGGDPLFPHNSGYNLNGGIMLSVVIALFVIVILLVLLHFYARYVLKQQARRRATIRPVSVGVRMVQVQVQSHEPSNTGLDPLVIALLPIFLYKQIDRLDHSSTRECAICLSTLGEEEMARLLPNCNHIFHAECIDMWLSSQSTCPVCRTEAEPRPQAESGKSVDGVLPTAPSLTSLEGTSDGAAQSAKVGGSGSRLSSVRMMLSRERSSRRIQPCGQEEGVGDLERQ